MSGYVVDELNKKVCDIIEEYADDNELVEMWNDYCGANCYDDDHIYHMYELNDLFYDRGATELLDALGDNFRHRDEYFKWGIYGLESFNDLYDKIDNYSLSDLADYLIDHKKDYGVVELRELFEELENEEEEGGDEE